MYSRYIEQQLFRFFLAVCGYADLLWRNEQHSLGYKEKKVRETNAVRVRGRKLFYFVFKIIAQVTE